MTAVSGVYFNVMVNAKGLSTTDKAQALAAEAKAVLQKNHAEIDALLAKVEAVLAF